MPLEIVRITFFRLDNRHTCILFTMNFCILILQISFSSYEGLVIEDEIEISDDEELPTVWTQSRYPN